MQASKLRVVIGDHFLNKTEVIQRSMEVRNIILHELYSRNSSHLNDIALVELNRKIIFNRAVSPACVPEVNVTENTVCIATGWGFTNESMLVKYTNTKTESY